MAIKGLTDSLRLRRDGKIRAGKKVTASNGKDVPQNTPHFLLHDAPQLIPILGESPKEIYCTVTSDIIEAAAPHDLRYYTKSELVCQGDGQIAAFFALGNHIGVTNDPFPGLVRARKRICNYRSCPDYQKNNCSEHMFLDVIIPQYSMGSVFTLETTSIMAVMNIISALRKAQIGSGGRLVGQVFRLFKDKGDVKFVNTKDDKISTRETDIVFMEHVPLSVYEEKFRNKISDQDWSALMAFRNSDNMVMLNPLGAMASYTSQQQQLAGPSTDQAALPPPKASSAISSPEDQLESVKKRANDPIAAEWFDKISKVSGKQNTESARIATARNLPDVQSMVAYLKGKIKELEAKNAPAQDQPPAVLPEKTEQPVVVEAEVMQPTKITKQKQPNETVTPLREQPPASAGASGGIF